jgi:hypothetical protein
MQIGPLELGEYHEWQRSTPVLDALGSVLGAGSVIVGGHAVLFFGAAMHAGDRAVAAANVRILTAVVLANGAFDLVRLWRRHYEP